MLDIDGWAGALSVGVLAPVLVLGLRWLVEM